MPRQHPKSWLAMWQHCVDCTKNAYRGVTIHQKTAASCSSLNIHGYMPSPCHYYSTLWQTPVSPTDTFFVVVLLPLLVDSPEGLRLQPISEPGKVGWLVGWGVAGEYQVSFFPQSSEIQ